MRVGLTLISCFSLCTIIHLLGFLLLSRLWKVQIDTVSLFGGPRLFRFRFRGTTIDVRSIPMGGSVKFVGMEADADPKPGTFNALHPLVRALIQLAGPLALLALAACLIGPIRADAAFRSGVVQFLTGMFSQARAKEQFASIAQFVPTVPWTIVLGFMAAKMAGFNALPIPVLNGGEALFTILRGRGAEPRWIPLSRVCGLLFMVAFVLAYSIAFVSFLLRGA
jgi:membrane-associated protease RseP (regulator of RpoE activity)